MPKSVEIEGLGTVEFPDAMDEPSIISAIENEILPDFKRRTAKRNELLAQLVQTEREGVLDSIVMGAATAAEAGARLLTHLDPIAAVSRPAVAIGKAAGVLPEDAQPMTLATPMIPQGGGEAMVRDVFGEAQTQIGKGVQAGVGQVIEAAVTPGNILLGAAGAAGPVALSAQKGALGAFSAEMARLAPQTAAAAGQVAGEGDPEAAAEKAVVAVAEGVLAPVLAKAALRRVPAPPPETQALPKPPPEIVDWGASDVLPDLKPIRTATEQFTQPFGAGHLPIVGKFLDPNVKATTPQAKAINTFYAEAANGGVADALGQSLGSHLAGRIDRVFPIDPKTGRIATVKGPDGQNVFASDFFGRYRANKSDYELTPEQTEAIELFYRIQDRQAEIKTREKILGEEGEVSGDYLPRVVVERGVEPGAEPATKPAAGRVGAKQPTQKRRLFDTEEEGFTEFGTRYLPSVEGRMVEGARQMYRAWAAKRLAEHPDLPSKTVSAFENELRVAYADALQSGSMTESRFQGVLESALKKRTVDQPAFRGKVFDADIAAELRSAFPQVNSTLRAAVSRVNNAYREVKFTLDFGVPALQGQLLWFYDPATFAKATGGSLRALGRGLYRGYSKTPANAYIVDWLQQPERLQAVRELAQAGSPLGRIPDLLESSAPKTVLERVATPHSWPAVGPMFRAAKESFSTFLDISKVELYSALKAARAAETDVELARMAETLSGSSRIETIGTRPTRSFLERNLFNAPAYTRSALNLVGGLVSNNASAGVFKKAVGQYLFGMTSAYVGSALALGMSWDEIISRLNPGNGAFLTLDIPYSGKIYRVGPQGIYRSLMRLMGKITKTVLTEPDRMMHLDSDNNPVVAWLRSHGSGIVATSWDAFSGTDYLGDDTDLVTLGGSLAPLSLQGNPSALEKGTAFLGLGAYELAPKAQAIAERDKLAKSRFDRPYDQLPLEAQVMLSREIQAKPFFEDREPATPRQRVRAEQFAMERQKRLLESMPRPIQDWLKAKDLRFRGFESEVRVGGTPLMLTKGQHERLEALVTEEYETSLWEAFEKPTVNQDVLDSVLTRARARARSRYLREQSRNR